MNFKIFNLNDGEYETEELKIKAPCYMFGMTKSKDHGLIRINDLDIIVDITWINVKDLLEYLNSGIGTNKNIDLFTKTTKKGNVFLTAYDIDSLIRSLQK